MADMVDTEEDMEDTEEDMVDTEDMVVDTEDMDMGMDMDIITIITVDNFTSKGFICCEP